MLLLLNGICFEVGQPISELSCRKVLDSCMVCVALAFIWCSEERCTLRDIYIYALSLSLSLPPSLSLYPSLSPHNASFQLQTLHRIVFVFKAKETYGAGVVAANRCEGHVRGLRVCEKDHTV